MQCLKLFTTNSGIIKTYTWSFTEIYYLKKKSSSNNETNQKTKITKHNFSNGNTHNFWFLSENIKWDKFLPSNAPIKAYNKNLKVFTGLRDNAFPIKYIEIKSKCQIVIRSLKV